MLISLLLLIATTQPAELIANLADTDRLVVESAMQQLAEQGQSVAEALREATNSPDPNINVRAEKLLHRLDPKQLPGNPEDPATGAIIGRNLKVLIKHEETKSVTVDEGTRHIKILVTREGIAVDISSNDPRSKQSESYRATTVEHLRGQNPEVGDIFDRWAGGEDFNYRVFRDQPDGRNIHLGGSFTDDTSVLRKLPDTELLILRKKLSAEMKSRNFPEAQQHKVIDLVDQLLKLLDLEREEADLDVFALSDELRALIKQLNLADPGALLPADADHRLGVLISAAVREHPLVLYVVPDSRADKMGLQEGDHIWQIQRQEIRHLHDLRRIMAETTQPLLILADRFGDDLRLEEK